MDQLSVRQTGVNYHDDKLLYSLYESQCDFVAGERSCPPASSLSNRNLFKLRARRVRRPGQRHRGDLGDCHIAGERLDLYARAAEGHIQTNGPLGGAQAEGGKGMRAMRGEGGKEKEDRGEVRGVGGGGRGGDEGHVQKGEQMKRGECRERK